MQQSILIFFLVLAGITILTFFLVYRSSIRAEDNATGMANALQKRMWFILILVVTLGIFASVTIPKSPYYQHADEQPSTVIHVGSSQFVFIMSHEALDPSWPVGESMIEVDANELVEFRVTSFDVNHGFAIYDPSHQLIAQTQCMPGYVNVLRFKFDTPGDYDILCLEYCGSGHQMMRGRFKVN